MGPANTIRGQKLGQFIDSHDVVVRLNHAWPLPAEALEDIGSRTDIIYHNLNPKRAPSRKAVKEMRAAGVKWIVSTHPTHPKHRRRSRPINFQKRINKGLIPFTTVSLGFRLAMRRKCGPTNTGILAMAHLLRQGVKSLHVTGFSFFTTEYAEYPGYKKIKPKMALRWHNQRKHKRYLVRCLAKDKRLSVDPFITKILTNFCRKHRIKSFLTRSRNGSRSQRRSSGKKDAQSGPGRRVSLYRTRSRRPMSRWRRRRLRARPSFRRLRRKIRAA